MVEEPGDHQGVSRPSYLEQDWHLEQYSDQNQVPTDGTTVNLKALAIVENMCSQVSTFKNEVSPVINTGLKHCS